MPAQSGVEAKWTPCCGQPDPLQPDDQHEHQPAARDGREEAREDAEGEGPDAEERSRNIGGVDAHLDEREEREQGGARRRGSRARTGDVQPIGWLAVGPDPVGDPDHHQHEAGGERRGCRASRSGSRVRTPISRSLRYDQIVPEEPERDRDEEDEPPGDRREHAAEDEADEHAADADDVVDPEREAALVGREGVGEDRDRVRDQERRADPLHDPEARSASRRPPAHASSRS